ncbi:hypothetical protein CCO03_11880 [Comamonas serinivorans]|uniref:DUF455 domain-containing protein n=1 Tax=Comamonas serinivorans TaxID=1082851 RepID=A0A1Y0ENX3_9BURK|nr:ferritin-like domain-containing protein [Comamonas serinivorans]ARU05286.1 hypothetical protein CCO03_11880 [Comamonas serinivorans]
MDLRHAALAALACADPFEKAQLAQSLHTRMAQACADSVADGGHAESEIEAGLPLNRKADLWAQAQAGDAALQALVQRAPGRPARPALVHPGRVPRRSPNSANGRAALLHAICHIEFNAINLALDAVWRFAGMPLAFYRDWLRVAAEEAKHFHLLHAHLQTTGHAYGDFDAHDGLWLMCEKTAHDITARMALVPRTLEARGLDATPLIQTRLRAVGTPDALAACDILDVILRDEVGHVAIGNHWFRWLCAQQGLEPVAHYGTLVHRHAAPRLKPPFNLAARQAAGFTQAELDFLLADFGPPP